MTELARGVYDHVVTRGLRERLTTLDADLVEYATFDPADGHEALVRHIATVARRALLAVPGSEAAKVQAQVELANQITAAIIAAAPKSARNDDLLDLPPQLLAAIVERPAAPKPVTFPERPQTPLATAALLTNNTTRQPSIGVEIAKEMASADSVDLLCAFIKRRGVRLLRDPMRTLVERGGRLRIITTTYMGATEQRALDELVELGAEVRVAYETQKTRLHAKAWMFRRQTGVSTAYVGSSNLSKSALVDGMEWNVRLSQLEQSSVLETFDATFEEYWNDSTFVPYDPNDPESRVRLARALRTEAHDGPSIDFTTVDVNPYPYQQEILEGLDSEREMHGRYRNLVVMATGTGKTIVAGLDYRRLRGKGVNSLLFVAHQRRILEQSRSVFRHVLGDGTFGELLVNDHRPEEWQHVFASIQSLNNLDLNRFEPGRFDMVIVDEFHHAQAATYQKLLRALEPRVLLGLTATPERADGQDIRGWFDGHTAVELRIWEALERQLLSPFQYFGVADNVDLGGIGWSRGQGYRTTELENVYTGNDARVRIILGALDDTVDVERMRGLGFCVSIRHAEFMANSFVRAGIPARALHSGVDARLHEEVIAQLKRGDLKMIFTVDLFNEGIDLPTVDTILLLRPTESATIFLQQLGRGLRLSKDKPYLTVLDFIGGQNANFRFDKRFRALTGSSRRRLVNDVEDDFPTLPPGSYIQLDRVAKDIVLDNVRRALRLPRKDMVAELRQLPGVGLATFLEETGFELEDLYRRKAWRGWTGLREEAGLATRNSIDDNALSTNLGRMLHIDDPDRVAALRDLAYGRDVPGRLGEMMRQSLFGKPAAQPAGADLLAASPSRQAEILEVADALNERISRVTDRLEPHGVNPLRVHARYSRNEACAAFGIADPDLVREGVKWLPAEQADIFFVTLNKTERHYSPTTMYADRAITESLFQWESQSGTPADSPVGQRYIHHQERGSTVHLFLRETKDADGDLGVPAYLYAGRMTYVQHSGDRPMRILWQLERPLPADVFHSARVAAA